MPYYRIMAKRIAILGSTGSIGKNALRVVDSLGPEYEIIALSAHGSFELLAQQVKKYRPKYVSITNPDYADAQHLVPPGSYPCSTSAGARNS